MILLGERKEPRAGSLFKVLEGKKTLLVLTHTNPDPDGMASGIALCHLVEEKLGTRSVFAFHGDIFRAENREMVRVLGLELVPYDEVGSRDFDAVALVDTQPGFGHTMIRDDVVPDIVIDHHVPPPGGIGIEIPFADIRTGTGATASILTEYLVDAEATIPPNIATALFYGLSTDTADFSRNVSDLDEKAHMVLLPKVDREALRRIRRPRIPVDYFRALGKALAGTEIYGSVVFSSLRHTDNPEMVAEMADLLVRLEGVAWAVCGGLYQNTYYISVRADEGLGKDAWLLLKDVLKDEGVFGGHGTVAGGRLPVIDTSERSIRKLENHLKKGFLDALGERGTVVKRLIVGDG